MSALSSKLFPRYLGVLRLLALTAVFFLTNSGIVSAYSFQAPPEISNNQKAAFDISFTGGGQSDSCEGSLFSGDSDIDRFLQVLADQESGGNPTAQNPGSSASGKYQYIDSTWRSRVSGADAVYPPGDKYPTAKSAPESVQDAVAYIEYSKKFIELKNDLFKLAISHFYPAGLTDESLLDTTIGTNTITPREYGESILKKIRSGEGKNIPLKYTQAPKFSAYNKAGDISNVVSSPDACGNFSGGDLSETTLAYAWPEYHEPNYLKQMPAYTKAVKKAQNEGRYIGGGSNPGVDCGGFVTTLLIDSGFEPSYNYGGLMSQGAGPTESQEAWVKANWKSLGSGSSIDTGALLPGDVAFSPGHTFIYVGKINGFDSVVASASYSPSNTSWRAPMAGEESLTSGDVQWYRKG